MTVLNPLIANFPKNAGYEHTDYCIQYGFFGVLLVWTRENGLSRAPRILNLAFQRLDHLLTALDQ